MDGSGNVYVADAGNERIQKWAPGATSGVTVAGGNGVGTGPNQFDGPYNVYVDGVGNVYVADAGNNRVQKWPPPSPVNTRYTPTAPGTYHAMVTDASGCTVSTNSIVIDPSASPSVSIVASATVICSGDTVSFTGTITNGGTAPGYQWQVNGVNAGSNSLVYTSSHLSDGDKISLSLSSNGGCANAVSDPVILTVNPSPHVDSMQVVSLIKGHSVQLDPGITGTIVGYLWTPATGLSGLAGGNGR